MEVQSYIRSNKLNPATAEYDSDVIAKRRANSEELKLMEDQGLAQRELARQQSAMKVVDIERSATTEILKMSGDSADAQIAQARNVADEKVKSLRNQAVAAQAAFNFPEAANLKSQADAIEKATPMQLAAMQDQRSRELASGLRRGESSIEVMGLRGSGQDFNASIKEFTNSQKERAIELSTAIAGLTQYIGNLAPNDPARAAAQSNLGMMQAQLGQIGAQTTAGIGAMRANRGFIAADINASATAQDQRNKWQPRAAAMTEIEQERQDALRDAAGDQNMIDAINHRAESQIGALIHGAMAPPEILHSASAIHERIQMEALEHPGNDMQIADLKKRQAALAGAGGGGGLAGFIKNALAAPPVIGGPMPVGGLPGVGLGMVGMAGMKGIDTSGFQMVSAAIAGLQKVFVVPD